MTFKYSKWILLSIFFWIFLIPLLIMAIVYRVIIHLILKLKFKDKYGGLVTISDSFFLSLASKCSIMATMYVKSQRPIDIYDLVESTLREKIFDNPELYPKLTGNTGTFAGHSFWIRNGCCVNDVLFRINIPRNVLFNERTLKTVTGEIANKTQPRNDTILWDIHVAETPILAKKNDGFLRYAIVVRFHHCVGDATSLFALLLQIFGGNTQNYCEEIARKFSKRPARRKSFKETFKYYLTNLGLILEVAFITLGRLNDLYSRPRIIWRSASRRCNYSKDKVISWTSEERVECVPLVKLIKNHTKSSFFAVLNTALSVSLTNYLKKKSSMEVPSFIPGTISFLLQLPKFNLSSPVVLENNASGGHFELPIHNSDTFLDTLDRVKEKLTKYFNYSNALILRLFVGHILGAFPLHLFDPLSRDCNSINFLMTNVPGSDKIPMFGSCILEQIVPIFPNFHGTAITVAFLTYDNKFQIGLSMDKRLINGDDDLQTMADDILDSIRLFAKELVIKSVIDC
ncbi:hypothetical protein ABEB36_011561 [Hypothenemus hampei]|uniref:O-acyltransferase WSD1 C-terminal domain-containing protein n=1 Tax=Hypothenemus hampei TaxID=57062 RepID=A0ABD1EAZ7_HYPHA